MASSIANATLGITLEFITLGRADSPKTPGKQTMLIVREGVDGAAYKNLGIRGETYRVRGRVDVINAASRETWIDDVRALKGALCTYVDDFDSSWPSQLVEYAAVSSSQTIANAAGGKQGAAGTIMLTVDFSLIDMRTSA